MKKIITTIVLLLFSIFSNAQTPNFTYVKSFGGYNYDYSFALDVDLLGNIYNSGLFYGTVDFDPNAGVFNLTSANAGNASSRYISKIDASGNFVWAKKIDNVQINSIKTDSSGNLYLTGGFSGTADFDPSNSVFNLTSSAGTNYTNIFVLKLDVDGNFVWAKKMGGSGNNNDFGQAIDVDQSGNVYTTGYFTGTANFDPNGTFNISPTFDAINTFISKLDNLGNFVWAKAVDGNTTTSSSGGASVKIDSFGNVICAGNFTGTANFNAGQAATNLISNGSYDGFISKLDSNGNFLWAKQVGGSGDDVLASIEIDANNNLFYTGYFSNTVDFDMGVGVFNLTTNLTNKPDLFVSKLDGNGDFIWAKQFKGSNYTNPNGTFFINNITLDSSGNVYTIGSLSACTFDFDPGIGVANITGYSDGQDAFISKLDSNGNYLWAVKLASPTNTGGSDATNIKIDSNNNIVVCGTYIGNIDFDVNAGSTVLNSFTPTATDIYLLKMSQTPLSTNNFSVANNLKIYPNPSTGDFKIQVDENLINAKADIYNILGQKIKSFPIDGIITIQNLDKGVYLIEIEKEGNKMVQKIVVQ